PWAFADFLDRGGWVAWGVVPTDRPLGETPEILWRRLLAEWEALAEGGCEPRRLVEQAIMTPACGLVGLDVAQAVHVLDLTDEPARRDQEPALVLVLPLGACGPCRKTVPTRRLCPGHLLPGRRTSRTATSA